MTGSATTFFGLPRQRSITTLSVSEALLAHPELAADDLVLLGHAVREALPDQTHLYELHLDNLLTGDAATARRELAHLVSSAGPHQEAAMTRHFRRALTPGAVQLRLFEESGAVVAALLRQVVDPQPLTTDRLGKIFVELATGQLRAEVRFQPNPKTDFILSHWKELSPIAGAPDRLTFAQRAEAFLQARSQQILNDLLSGKEKPGSDYGAQLSALVGAVNLLVDAVDQYHRKATPRWLDSKEAGTILHDHVQTPLQQLSFAAIMMTRKGGLDLVSANNLVRSAPRRKPMEMIGIVQSALLQNVFGLAGKEIQIRVNVPEGLQLKNLEDRKLLIQNLAELINNAIKYVDPAKPIRRIEIRWDASRQALVVADNGIGIKDTAAVWDKGVREAPAAADGSGEGLWLVKQRFDQIGWRVELVSKPEVGTTFLLLPPADGVMTESQ